MIKLEPDPLPGPRADQFQRTDIWSKRRCGWLVAQSCDGGPRRFRARVPLRRRTPLARHHARPGAQALLHGIPRGPQRRQRRCFLKAAASRTGPRPPPTFSVSRVGRERPLQVIKRSSSSRAAPVSGGRMLGDRSCVRAESWPGTPRRGVDGVGARPRCRTRTGRAGGSSPKRQGPGPDRAPA